MASKMHQMPNTLGLWASQPLAMSHVPRKQCCMRGAHACVSVVADDPLSRRRSCTILKDRDAPSRVSRCQLLNVGGCSHLRPPGRLPLPLSHAPRERHSGASANAAAAAFPPCHGRDAVGRPLCESTRSCTAEHLQTAPDI